MNGLQTVFLTVPQLWMIKAEADGKGDHRQSARIASQQFPLLLVAQNSHCKTSRLSHNVYGYHKETALPQAEPLSEDKYHKDGNFEGIARLTAICVELYFVVVQYFYGHFLNQLTHPADHNHDRYSILWGYFVNQ